MWDNKKRLQVEFIEAKSEVSDIKYFEMLEVLPPAEMCANAFLVGEPTTHNKQGQPVYELYFIKDDKFYYGGLCDSEDFRIMLIPNN
jgi:hypothetical protein